MIVDEGEEKRYQGTKSSTTDGKMTVYTSTAPDETFSPPRPMRANPSVVGVSNHILGKIRPVIKWPNKILETPCEDVTEFDDELGQLIMDMQWTMATSDGIGLAAPQVGVSKNVIVIDTSDSTFRLPNPLVLINPTIRSESQEMFSTREGCLSVPGYFEDRTRLAKVRIKYRDPRGKEREITLEGMDAFVAQHEMDHLSGKTFVDELSSLKKKFVKKKMIKTLKG